MIKRVLIALIIFSYSVLVNAKVEFDYFALCYHDVRNDVVGELDQDSGALNTQHLIQHFQWLKDNGYTVVSLQQIMKAQRGEFKLPEKAVYLTFDDGYRSFYDTIYPLLQLYNYPATFALVTNWIESDTPVAYGNKFKNKDHFLTWKQVKEMHQSGLIDIASHTHDMHKGIIANPQGNLQPAATSLKYNKKYESEADYLQRINSDLQKSFDLIEQHIGVPPVAIVWPYGSFSEKIWELAKEIGFQQSLVLDKGQNILAHHEGHIFRALINDNPSQEKFAALLKPFNYKSPERVVHVDLDYVFDSDKKQQEKNIGQLVERIHQMQISTVYLQAFADTDGDGNASQLYFPNRYLPVKEDLFNRVAWQLKTRANVRVFAWMPVSAFDLGDDYYSKHGVKAFDKGKVVSSLNNYKRLSIFDTDAKNVIAGIYSDLAKHSFFEGILFHDDGLLTDAEDVSESALQFYKKKGLEFIDINTLVSSKNSSKWSEIKAQALIDFTLQLSKIVKEYNPNIKTARNLYAQPILNPHSKSWFAQDLKLFMDNYDYTAVMAMPYMEQANDSLEWLNNLLDVLDGENIAKEKVVLELQSKDWRNNRYINEQVLSRQMKLFLQRGYLNYGYYPDNFVENKPALSEIIPAISINTYPKGSSDE